ncbi:hypothetical protein RYX36_025754 [Vicia faba]
MNLTVGIPHSTTLNLFPQTRIRISTIKSIQYNPPHPPKKVVVCGGGVIGVCTAYFLAMKGAAVTLIEKSKIACAASGKAGGFLALDWCDGGPIEQLARTSFNLPCSLSQELNGSRSFRVSGLKAHSIVLEPREPNAITPHALFLSYKEHLLTLKGSVCVWGVEGGILNGPATGAAVAELVLDGHSTIVDLEKFSPARFAGCAKA